MSRPVDRVPASARPDDDPGAVAHRSVSGIVGDTILGSADVARTRERRRIVPAPPPGGRGRTRPRLDRHPSHQRARRLPHRPPAARAGHRAPHPPHRLHAGGGHAGPPPLRRALTAHAHPARRDPGGPGGPGGHRPHQGRGGALHQPVPRPSDVPRRHGRVRPARRALRGAARDRQDLRRQGHGQGGQRPLPVRVRLGLPVDVLRPDEPQDPLLLQAAPQARPQGGRRHRLHRGDRRHRRHPARHGRQRRDRGRVRRGQRAAGAAAVLRHPDPGAAHRLGLDRPAQPLPPRRQQAAQAGRGAGQRAGGGRHQPQGRPRPGAHPARAASTAPSTSGCRGAGPGPTSSPTTSARRRTPPISTSTAPSTSSPA